MDATESVMQNPIVVEKIVNFLKFNSLKTCRSLNTLWYQEVTKVLKKKSVILVSKNTIAKIMKNNPFCKEIFSTAARLDTSFGLGDTPWLLNFFRTYSKFLEYIVWTDSAAVCHDDKDELDPLTGMRRFFCSTNWNFNLPNLNELELLPTFSFGDNLTLILKSAPNLRILRVDFVPHDYYCMNEFLTALEAQTDLRNLKILHFGENTYLRERNVKMLIKLPNLELEEFIMEGRMLQIQSAWVYKAILERWSQTLVTVEFRTMLPFQLSKTMEKLKKFSSATLRLKRTLPMNIRFPSLENFEVNYDSDFKFNAFIPENMEPHQNMKHLSLMGQSISNKTLPWVKRMFDKFTNLTTLSIPTTDEFLQRIYTSCPNLKGLYIRGTFTDLGVTGIENKNLDIFYGILKAAGKVVGEDKIQKRGVRKWKSILDLKKLEVLSLSNCRVGDKSVLWGVIPCKTLKTLYLPGSVTDISLDALMGMEKLRELSIAVHQGNITFAAMRNFSAKMVHVELRCGNAASNFNEGRRITY